MSTSLHNDSDDNVNNFKIEDRRRQVASLLAQSMTESEIAQELNVDQSTISRDVKALKEMSQQFVFDLAKSDLAYYFKRSIDGIEEAKKETWPIYGDDNSSVKEKLATLKLIIESNEARFKLLSEGPSVLRRNDASLFFGHPDCNSYFSSPYLELLNVIFSLLSAHLRIPRISSSILSPLPCPRISKHIFDRSHKYFFVSQEANFLRVNRNTSFLFVICLEVPNNIASLCPN